MGAAKQNRLIARIIVGAIAADGEFDDKEKQKAISTLQKLGMDELIADFGIALDEDDTNFNLFKECSELVESLGSNATEVCPLLFRLIAEVVASDRFVTMSEATYLSSVAKRLNLSNEQARKIFKEVMAKTKGRLEASGKDISETLNPALKDFLSFEGAEEIVGELDKDSLLELLHESKDAAAAGGEKVTIEEVEQSLAVLGLSGNAKLADAETVWKETIANLNLAKLADLGETFVSAAIQRIQTINNAYKIVLQFYNATKKR